MDSVNLTTGNDTNNVVIKEVGGDNTEINNSTLNINVELLRELLFQEKPEALDSESEKHFLELKSSEPDKFQKALSFFLGIAEGVTVRWLSKIMLS